MAIAALYPTITVAESADTFLVLDSSDVVNGYASLKRIDLNNLASSLAGLSSDLLTASGDLLTHNGSTDTVLGVGSDNTTLIADSGIGVGLKWGHYVPYQQEGTPQAVSFSVASTDHGLVIPVSGNITITLPNSFPVGWQCMFRVTDSGTTKTFAATGTLQSQDGLTTCTVQHAIIWAYHTGANVWLIQGNLA